MAKKFGYSFDTPRFRLAYTALLVLLVPQFMAYAMCDPHGWHLRVTFVLIALWVVGGFIIMDKERRDQWWAVNQNWKQEWEALHREMEAAERELKRELERVLNPDLKRELQRKYRR